MVTIVLRQFIFLIHVTFPANDLRNTQLTWLEGLESHEFALIGLTWAFLGLMSNFWQVMLRMLV